MRKFKRLTMTLALLIMAVGGAWAQTTVTWDSNTWADWTDNSVKTHTVDGVTITTGGTAYAVKSNDNLYIWVTGNANTLTFSSDTPITRIEMTKATPSTTLRLTPNDGWSVSTDGTTVTWEGTATKSLVCETCTLTVSKIKFYLETAAEPTEVIELKPDADKKVWTLAEMPASNIMLQVEYEPTKVTMAANDKTMGTVEVGGESKVEWTAETWQGWTTSTKEYTVDDITMTSSNDAYIYELKDNSLNFFVEEDNDNSTVTFSTTGDPFSRIEFTMLDDYSDDWNPSIMPNDNWTFEGKSAVWEGEATKSLTLQSCTTQVSKITFFKGAVPDGVIVNGDGTFTVAKTATVTLTATPKEGYKFLYWADDQTNTNPVREVTIESGMADMTYKAVFEEILYNVTFADGIEDADKWKAEPNAAAKNTEIKVTYSGTKKVIDVKVEKKAPTEGHALSASAVGEIVGSDGKAYAVADKDNLPEGVTAVAMVASKNGSNGLAIQLNSSPVEKTWAEAKTYAEGLTAVPGGTWRLPSMADWQTMFVSCAVTGDAGVSDFMDPIAGFNAKIAATGIEWLSYNYWSSTGTGDSAWYVFVGLAGSPYAAFYQSETSDEYKYLVLGCLFF